MKFCSQLITHMAFFEDCIRPCCGHRRTDVPRFSFTGGSFDIKAYQEFISNTFDEIQYEPSVCSGCIHLVDVNPSLTKAPGGKWGDLLKIKNVSLNQHRFFCDCKCIYCVQVSQKAACKPYEVLPTLKLLIQENMLKTDCFFSWGGGETTLLREFDTACDWIQRRGYFQQIHTNALHYSKSISSLLSENKGSINVSLDSGTEEGYRHIKGLNGWTKVIENLRAYADSACSPDSIHLKYIVFEANNQLKEIAAFLDLCSQLNVTVHYSLNFDETKDDSVSQKTLTAAAFLKHRAKELGLVSIPFFVPPAFEAAISEAGKAFFSTRN